MRHLLVVLLAACGPMPTTPDDAGDDAGAGNASVRFTLTWQTPSCEACTASADVAPEDLAAVRVSFSSTLNGWACNVRDTAADCTYRCGRPPGTADAGCAWAPCLGGPLECR